MVNITTEIITKTKEWLGKEGIKFFREVKSKHGKINAVWVDGLIPHAVHFREGMQVRNFLRSINCDWTSHEYDDNWVKVIEECIAEDLI